MDHPWWNTHTPPNGWGCKCRARQVSKLESRSLGGPTKPPPVKMRSWKNRRTGQTEKVPVGIDPGWDTNPGRLRLAGLVPPETDLPPTGPEAGAAAPSLPMPTPRQADAGRLLPEGQSPESYARAFLREFGADLGKDAVHVDQTGMPIVVSEALFRSATGHWKAGKRRRGEMMLLLADSLREPDEIWEHWQTTADGRNMIHRYCLARWEVGAARRPALLIFRWSNQEWSGATAFGPDQERYLLAQRRGDLRYRREDPEK